MSQPPSTPVKVPSAAANYTPATLDPDLRSSINTLLLKDGHIATIQESLLHALNSNSTNWPTTIQSHALTLLRSGEVTSFPALLRRVLDDIAEETNPATKNGGKATNGDNSKKVNGASSDGKVSLAVPDAVVQEALKVTRESLETVCEIDENGVGL
ncbi:hypothetical protein LIA77_10276 [Sarocladium implicatum]|nr:hypothetical protein LIA77_10276 [Sarocladium implicatum]